MNAVGPSAGSPTGAPAKVRCGALVERQPPGHRRLHRQVVRMLVIDERQEVVPLADLKQLAIAAAADGGRFRG